MPVTETTRPHPNTTRRAIVAGSIGNFLELFDLTVFGFFAVVIGAQFFPNDDPTASLLAAFATFGVGFLARPLGAFVFGRIGDKYGRKRLLFVTMALMGVASLLIAVLPGYESIGIAAPVLLVAARLLQGLAAGGEWGGAVTLIVEYAPPARRGLFGSFQQMGFSTGILLGAFFSYVLHANLDGDQLAGWGWRIPFLVGVVLVPLALYIRRAIPETEDFRTLSTPTSERTPLRTALTMHWRAILLVIAIGVLGTTGGYIADTFMNAFAVGTLGLDSGVVSELIMWAVALDLLLIPFWGWLSDRVGRYQVMFGAAVLYALTTIPLFLLLTGSPTPGALILLIAVQHVFLSATAGPMPAAFAELFPAAVRTTGLTIGYSITVALFGGFAPYVATFLVATTGLELAPALYSTTFALVTATATGTLLVRTLRQRRMVPIEAEV